MQGRRLILPIASLCGLAIAIYVTFFLVNRIPNLPPEYPPPIPSYEHFVAGEGLIEAVSENIEIGVPFGDLVEEVYVTEGDVVKEGTPLFVLDRRARKAELMAARNEVVKSLADYSREYNLPRFEEVEPLEKEVAVAKAEYEDQKKQLELYERVRDKRAISEDMLNQKRYAEERAYSNYERKQKELDLKNAGAWSYDLDIAQARVDIAKAKLQIAEVAYERGVIRAPIDGQVLQIKVREGQFASTMPKDPLMRFGKVSPMVVRVEVDETEAWRVRKGAKATAYVRGNSAIKLPLKFIRIEPYIVPKRNLTGDPMERVDMRVLEVLYEFDPNDLPLYVGQMLDIYIEAKTNGQPSRGKKK